MNKKVTAKEIIDLLLRMPENPTLPDDIQFINSKPIELPSITELPKNMQFNSNPTKMITSLEIKEK